MQPMLAITSTCPPWVGITLVIFMVLETLVAIGRQVLTPRTYFKRTTCSSEVVRSMWIAV